jgi:hypothetical protein
MFGNTGDLVLQRKVEKPHLTVERVEEAVENVVVQPTILPEKKVAAVAPKVEAVPEKVEAVVPKVEVEKVAETATDAPKKNNRKGK